MNIKQTFLDLTSETYPHGTEEEILHLLPNNLEKDEFGNLFVQIGENPSTMFTSHLDTASRNKTLVHQVIEGNIIKTDGSSILGADDKAGVTIMLYMIEKGVKGLYYFFLGEERGCIGSKKLANKHISTPIEYIKKVISFDRRGTNSVITHQSGLRCCSETFATYLSKELNENAKIEKSIELEFKYTNDPTGVYTDSYQFTSIYPECTNISVGYFHEHTNRESQDILHLEKLCKTLVLINWEKLPVERDVNECESDYNFETYFQNKYYYNYKKKEDKTKKNWFIDEDYGRHVSFVSLNEKGETIDLDIHKDRIEKEKNNITKLLHDLEISVKEIDYNGIRAIIEHTEEHGGHKTVINREEISEYMHELNFWKKN